MSTRIVSNAKLIAHVWPTIPGHLVSGLALIGAKEIRGTSGQRDWILTSQKNNSIRQRMAQLPSTSPARVAITAEGMSRGPCGRRNNSMKGVV
jgi:hypothetical protein